MAIKTSNELIYQDDLRELAEKIDAAGHGMKSVVKREFMQRYAISRNTLHKHLAKIGWKSGRKRRADAGKTNQDEATLIEIGVMLKESLRRNNKQTMHITLARSILAESNRKITVSNSRLAQLLRQINMDIKSQKQAPAAQSIVTLHPNHMHQADPSLCLLYYTPNGQQHVLRDDEIYKNKPQWVEKVGNLKCWRYVLTDHYSGSIIVRYYQARGETQENMYDFLLYCWKQLEGRTMHGVPKILYTDKGSAHTAGGIQNAIESLGVKWLDHKAGNARATGSVEGAQNIVETQFESRLKYEPVKSVDELNQFAERWYIAHGANSIKQYDSRLKRRGMREPMARTGIWQTIRQEQLKILPDLAVCKWLMVNDPKQCKVSQHLEVSFKFPGDKRVSHWDVAHIPGIGVDSMVSVQPLIMTRSDEQVGKQILIKITDYAGNETHYTAVNVDFDPVSGIKQSGAIAGEEFKNMPESDIDIAATRIARQAYPNMSLDEIEKQRKKNAVPLKNIDSLSHLEKIKTPAYMKRPGTAIDVPNKVQIETKPLSILKTKKALISMGLEMTESNDSLLRQWYPEGVLEDDLGDVFKRLNAPKTKLRIIGE